MQFLSGYCILQSDPVVESLNALDVSKRVDFLNDMGMVGDAIMEATGACRINYFIAGNSDPVLHAHIVPRFLSEPDEFRQNHPWSYPEQNSESTRFNPKRDRQLIENIKSAIQKRL